MTGPGTSVPAAGPGTSAPVPGVGADRPVWDEVAYLDEYGPIPSWAAHALAANGPWSRMVTDPVDRSVLSVSAPTYRPPPAMAELVRAREPECVNPTCGINADRCDLHHQVPWPIGLTTVTNLDPNCRRDHLLLTHAGWTSTRHSNGHRTWTTTTGHTYTQNHHGHLTHVSGPYGDGQPLRSQQDRARQAPTEHERARQDRPGHQRARHGGAADHDWPDEPPF